MEGEIQPVHHTSVLKKIIVGCVTISGLFLFIGIKIGRDQSSNYPLSTYQTTIPLSGTPAKITPTKTTRNQTADWLVYSNPASTYIFKYPKTWIVMEGSKTLICPQDYVENQESSKECFTLTNESRSFSKFVSSIEDTNNTKIIIDPSQIRYANGNIIYHIFREGTASTTGFSYSYVTNAATGKSIAVMSARAWNDYLNHEELRILDTLEFVHKPSVIPAQTLSK